MPIKELKLQKNCIQDELKGNVRLKLHRKINKVCVLEFVIYKVTQINYKEFVLLYVSSYFFIFTINSYKIIIRIRKYNFT